MLGSEMSIVRTIEKHRARDPTGNRWVSATYGRAQGVGKDCLLDNTSTAYAYGDLRDNLLTS
ncbi:MAG: hypothetical protein WBG53_20990 [Rhodococcus sp. (in: high G+C Gram-positive bacteria)]